MTGLCHHLRVKEALKGELSSNFVFSGKQKKGSLHKFTLAVKVMLIKVIFVTWHLEFYNQVFFEISIGFYSSILPSISFSGVYLKYMMGIRCL